MKSFLLLLVLAGSGLAASAQQKNMDSLRQAFRDRFASKLRSLPGGAYRSTPYSRPEWYGRDSVTGQPLTLLPPQRAGAYNLPIDGMPCVVPDTNGIAAMPNAFGQPQLPYRPARNIPNPMDKIGAPLPQQ